MRDLTSFLTEDTMRYLTSNFIENKMRNLILTSNYSSSHSPLAIVLGRVCAHFNGDRDWIVDPIFQGVVIFKFTTVNALIRGAIKILIIY